MKRRRVLAVLGTVGTGGCLRLTNSDDESTAGTRSSTTRTATEASTETATVTTTRTDTETETRTETRETTTEEPEPAPYPEGLSADGVGEYLYPVHESTLSATNFHVEWSKFDRSVGEFKWRKRYDFEVGQALGRAMTRPMGGPADVYRANGLGALWREDLGDGYTYGADSHGWDSRETMWDVEIRPLVQAGVWGAPERVNVERPAVWEVSADSVVDSAPAIGYYDGETVGLSGTLRVDERGFIRGVEATHRLRPSGSSAGEVREFETSFAVDSVGDVSVSKPSWLSTAKERRPEVSASLVDDGRYVELTLEDGNRIEANSVLSVWDEALGSSPDARLSEPMASGEKIYLYRDETDSYPGLRISRGGKPSSTPSRDLSSAVDTRSRRATLMYFETDL
jgi:hypothetical protein